VCPVGEHVGRHQHRIGEQPDGDKLALRRALSMAYDVDAEIEIIRKGQAEPLGMLIPPGVAGYATRYRSGIKHDPEAANALLDRFGYRKGDDGYRRLPNGKPLVLTYASQTTALAREFDELWKKAMDSLRIHLSIEKGKFSDQIREAIACRYQIWSYGWIADYPDGDNFMQLLYGGNIGQSNVACYRSPTYDALYERSRLMPDSPDRDHLFERDVLAFGDLSKQCGFAISVDDGRDDAAGDKAIANLEFVGVHVVDAEALLQGICEEGEAAGENGGLVAEQVQGSDEALGAVGERDGIDKRVNAL
jgi:hypothetical protein